MWKSLWLNQLCEALACYHFAQWGRHTDVPLRYTTQLTRIRYINQISNIFPNAPNARYMWMTAVPPESHHSIFFLKCWTWARTIKEDKMSKLTQYIPRQIYFPLCMFLTRSYTYIPELHSQTCVSNQNVWTYKTLNAFTVQPFGEFGNRNEFHGWVPGEECLRDVFVACFSTMCTFLTFLLLYPGSTYLVHPFTTLWAILAYTSYHTDCHIDTCHHIYLATWW